MKKPHSFVKPLSSKSTTPNMSSYLLVIILVVLSILPLFPLFQGGLPITHDGKDHVARIASFYSSLEQGVLFPRWAANLNWGYGHPILMFLYPLPSYVGSFFHFLGFSYVDSVKLVFGSAYILSGLTMYFWVQRFLSKETAFLAAILYLYAPYRFVDMHVRGAIGEHVAFIFPPLVLYFLLKVSQKKDFFTVGLGALSLAGLFLSHNAISIMFLPIFILYAAYLFFLETNKKSFALYAGMIFILGFCLAAFFLIPALLEGKYTLRDIVTSVEYTKRFVPFTDFIYGQWNFGGSSSISKQVGVLHWILLLVSGYVTYIWYKKKNTLWLVSAGVIALFSLSLFIMMDMSLFIWDRIKILQNFQFPWRFLSLTVFLTAVSGALVVYAIPKRIQLIIIIILSSISILLTTGYWQVNGYLQKPESFFSGIYEGTTDTGESAPIWSVRFMEKRPKTAIEVVEGNATITMNQRQTTKHTYTIDAKERTRIRENTLYFPGWEVQVDNVPVSIEFQDPKHRGLMTFYVEKGTHTVSILFRDTKIRLFSNIVSLVAFVIIGIFCIMKVGLLWKHYR